MINLPVNPCDKILLHAFFLRTLQKTKCYKIMLKFKEQTDLILGACMEVHNELKNGFLEPVYQEALEREFQLQGIPYEREKKLNIYYKGELLKKEYFADFYCFDNIIVELKAVSRLESEHKAQVINYLKAINKEIGLLINFGKSSLQWERISIFGLTI